MVELPLVYILLQLFVNSWHLSHTYRLYSTMNLHTFSSWLHDPSAGWVPPELLYKNIIVSRQHKGDRDKVCRTGGE